MPIMPNKSSEPNLSTAKDHSQYFDLVTPPTASCHLSNPKYEREEGNNMRDVSCDERAQFEGGED